MSLYDQLVKRYGPNTPIFFSEIKYQDYSTQWIQLELRTLCSRKKLKRFERGIYYIPTSTPFGDSLLDPRKVIEKKYIRTSEATFGYYSGAAFLNQLGLSTQMPNVIEICTNHEASKRRTVTVGKQTVYLRKARTTITDENVYILSFMEMMNSIDRNFLTPERRRLVQKYMRQKNITGKDIAQYAPDFPDRTMRTLVESEVIFDAAR